MFDSSEQEFLEELLITPSPTGFEAAGQKVWTDYVEDFADDIQSDAYGSACAKLNTSFDVITVMLEAHCDEIGMIVQHITDDGYIYVNKLGGSDSTIAKAKRVNIHTSDGIVSGVTGNTAIHLQDKKNGGGEEPAWKDIYVDIGASSREEALKMVQVGDPVTYAEDFEFLSDKILTGRALDNRIGGYIIAQALRKLNERRDELKVNVMALNSVQEEVGGYGARMMSFRLEPDVALVTDVTHATDSPGINNKEHGLIKLGKGPVLLPIRNLRRRKEDNINKKMISLFISNFSNLSNLSPTFDNMNMNIPSKKIVPVPTPTVFFTKRPVFPVH